jgi:pimeloyl-ACP methyl ester carboxylesterase
MRAVAGITPEIPGRLVRVLGTAHHVVLDEAPPGSPVVVFSSCLGGAWYDWNAVVPLLSGRCTVVRFDRPGLGWSQPAPLPPTLAGEARRIAELTAALGLSGPYVVVGHSLAGFHVEAFARLFPELTSGVVLVDSSTEPEAIAPPAYSQRIRRWRLLGRLAQVSGLVGPASPPVRRLVVKAVTLHGPDRADPAAVAATFAAARPPAAALLENATYFDIAAQLLELRCERAFPAVPLRVLAAFGASRIERTLMPRGLTARMRDRWRARQLDLAALTGGGELVELEDSAHYVPFDRPDAVADAVLAVIGPGQYPAHADGIPRGAAG